MVLKKSLKHASMGLAYTFVAILPISAKAEAAREGANSNSVAARANNNRPLSKISTEAAAANTNVVRPVSHPPIVQSPTNRTNAQTQSRNTSNAGSTANNVARQSNNQVARPRYGRLITNPVTHSNTPTNVVENQSRNIQVQNASRPSQATSSTQNVEFKPISDVRPEDVAPWQKIGAPYQVNGIWYIPAHEPDYNETGSASWYGNGFNGHVTANGEIFDENIVSVAHPTLPMASLVEVTNLENGRSIIARVNDRGPFVGNRLVDVSARGAELLGFKEQGSAQVRVRYIGQAPQAETTAPRNLEANNLQIGNVTTRGYVPTRMAQTPQTRPIAPNVQTTRNPVTTTRVASANIASSRTSNRYVQIGVFSNRTNAERALHNVDTLGNTKIVPIDANGNSLYRAVLGPFNDAASANNIASEAINKGVEGAHVIVASIS